MRSQQQQLKGALILLITALIWGTAFVAQSVGTEYVGPFTFISVRNFIGCAFLLPIIYIFKKMQSKDGSEDVQDKQDKAAGRKYLLAGGITCGIILCAASALQQIGIQYTSVGKAGFLTALYIVIVPIIGIFFKKKPGMVVIISVIIALIGTYLLSVTEEFKISMGDIFVILCAVMFSFHIIAIDFFAPKTNGIMLSCMQFFVCAVISLVIALIFESPRLLNILEAWLPLVYTGVMSSGVAFTLQIIGQRKTSPAVAVVVMSMESVFAALAGWLILGQALTAKEIAGCVMVFAAVIIAQLPSKKACN